MANMKYFRFYNTTSDIRECILALREYDIESVRELGKAEQMVTMMAEFLYEQDIVELPSNYKQRISEWMADIKRLQEKWGNQLD